MLASIFKRHGGCQKDTRVSAVLDTVMSASLGCNDVATRVPTDEDFSNCYSPC